MDENEFSKNLGTDWLAMDAQDNILARASSKDAVQRAAPNAAKYLQGKAKTPPKVKEPKKEPVQTTKTTKT